MKIPEISVTETVALPLIGLGTWMLKGESCTKAVQTALEIGYRHVDTAYVYDNHRAVGKALRNFKRNDLFITSKFTIPQLDKETVAMTYERALEELEIDYLDLYLLHYPDRTVQMEKIFHEMLELVHSGKCRSVGVCNFTKRHLQDMLDLGVFMPVNQVEFHPYLNQKELLFFCQTHNIILESYRPLGKGVLVLDPIFESIGKKYRRTPAQICLRWIIEKKIPVIPKATSLEHMQENFSIFDFSLDPDDFKILDNLSLQKRFCSSQAWVDFDYI